MNYNKFDIIYYSFLKKKSSWIAGTKIAILEIILTRNGAIIKLNNWWGGRHSFIKIKNKIGK